MNTLLEKQKQFFSANSPRSDLLFSYSCGPSAKSRLLQTTAAVREKALNVQAANLAGHKLLTKAQQGLPNITNQSFFPPNGKSSITQSKVPLAPIISKCNRRVGNQRQIMSVLLGRSRRQAVGRGSGKVDTTWQRNLGANIGIINVHCTRNNTLLTLSGAGGRGLLKAWASAGSLGFKNSRKSTTYASQAAAKGIALKAKQCGCSALHVALRGTGRAKAVVVRTLSQSAVRILTIRECTPAVHNGCRRPKTRRI